MSEFEALRPGDLSDPALTPGHVDALRRDASEIRQTMGSLADSYAKLAEAQLEMIGQLREHFKRTNRLEARVDDHSDRIAALEQRSKAKRSKAKRRR